MGIMRLTIGQPLREKSNTWGLERDTTITQPFGMQQAPPAATQNPFYKFKMADKENSYESSSKGGFEPVPEDPSTQVLTIHNHATHRKSATPKELATCSDNSTEKRGTKWKRRECPDMGVKREPKDYWERRPVDRVDMLRRFSTHAPGRPTTTLPVMETQAIIRKRLTQRADTLDLHHPGGGWGL